MADGVFYSTSEDQVSIRGGCHTAAGGGISDSQLASRGIKGRSSEDAAVLMNPDRKIRHGTTELHGHFVACTPSDVERVQNRAPLAVPGIIGLDGLYIGIPIAVRCGDRGVEVAVGHAQDDCVSAGGRETKCRTHRCEYGPSDVNI